MLYETRNLIIAQLQVCKDKKLESEVGKPSPLVVLYQKGDTIINPFDQDESYPLLAYTPVGMELVSPTEESELKDGIYYVQNNYKNNLDQSKINFTQEELEDYILSSTDFYKDRLKIAKDKIINPYRLLKILLTDKPHYNRWKKIEDSFNQETKQKQYCKK